MAPDFVLYLFFAYLSCFMCLWELAQAAMQASDSATLLICMTLKPDLRAASFPR